MSRDASELHWIEYRGFIARATARAIALQAHGATKIECWLPRSQVKRITYADGGDATEVRVGRVIESIEIPWWLASKSGLTGGRK